MNPLYLIAVLVISLIYVWTLYNIPIVVAGVRNLRSGKRKRKFSGGSQKSLPAMSIIVPVKDEEKGEKAKRKKPARPAAGTYVPSVRMLAVLIGSSRSGIVVVSASATGCRCSVTPSWHSASIII